jgi:hypothetical protein
MPVASEEMIKIYDRRILTSELAKEFNYLLDVD